MSSNVGQVWRIQLFASLLALTPETHAAEGITPPSVGTSFQQGTSNWNAFKAECKAYNDVLGNWFARPGAVASASGFDPDNGGAAGEFAVMYRTCRNSIEMALRASPTSTQAAEVEDVGNLLLVPSQGATSALVRWTFHTPHLLPRPMGASFATWGPYITFEAGQNAVELPNTSQGGMSAVRFSAGAHYTVQSLIQSNKRNRVGLRFGIGGTVRGQSSDDFDSANVEVDGKTYDGEFEAAIQSNRSAWFGFEAQAGLHIGDLTVLFEIPWMFGDQLAGLTGLRVVPFISVAAPISLDGG